MNSYLFTSKRLGIRNWSLEDLEPFAKMNQDKDVMEFFPKTSTTKETREMILRLQEEFIHKGFTFYAVELLENKEFIGFIGLIQTVFVADFTPCVEIGWRLKKSAWNKGYATEGALRCLEYAFNELNLNEIYSFTPSINKKSERVMQKIGMKKVKEFNHPKIDKGHILEKHVLYKIEK